MNESKEWIRVSHAGNKTHVTVTIVEDNLSVRWSVKCYASTLKWGVEQARAGARKALAELHQAIAELEADAA